MTNQKTPRRNRNVKFVNYEHLDKIGEIAVYYGFTPAKSPSITKTDLDAAKDILDGDTVDDETDNHGRLLLHVEEKIALMRMYHEENMHTLNQPVMFYFKDPCRNFAIRRPTNNTAKKTSHRYADLEILGGSGSIAEATLIQATRAILREEGYKNTLVEVNSVGDRDSMARFVRELTAYYRKHINDMSPECRQILKRDPFELLSSQEESCKALNEKAPKSLDFLSEISRRHLEELLEYFETLSIPYTLNNALVGNRKYCTETIFAVIDADAITNKKNQRVLAIGMRYNGLAKRLNMKRDVHGVGISILIKGGKDDLRRPLSKIKRPLTSFIQLGLESKLISLDIVERLRQIKIPLYFSLAKDRLGAQVSTIERHHSPFVIIMGKKEAVERTAIVRRTDTHAQEVVHIDELPKHMKKMEMDYWAKKP